MLSHLLTMPAHLLHNTLSSCLATTRENLQSLYATFPPALHGALISCAASAASLTVPTSADAMFYVLLSQASIFGQGMQDLSVKDTLSATKAALLAHVLAAHQTLVNVDLTYRSVGPAALRTLATGLPPSVLPALRSLKLSTVAHPGDASALADLLKKLPSVSSVSLDIYHEYGDGVGLMPAADRLSSAVRSAAYPACLPHLQELRLYEVYEDDESGEDDAAHRRASASRCAQLLAFMRAPELSSVRLQPERSRGFRPAALLASLARFPNLTHLEVDAVSCELAEVQVPVALEVVTLPPLQTLTVAGACSLVADQMSYLFVSAAVQSLTCLRFGRSDLECGRGDCRKGNLAAMWRSMGKLWAAVGKCVHLQHLEMEVCAVGVGWSTGPGESIAKCLGQLSKLTHLSLRPAEAAIGCGCAREAPCMIHGEHLRSALKGLPCLEELHVCNRKYSHMQIVGAEALLKGCAELTALRVLGLWAEGVRVRLLAEMLPQLQSLTKLVLLPRLFEGDPLRMNALVEGSPGVQIERSAAWPRDGLAVVEQDDSEASMDESSLADTSESSMADPPDDSSVESSEQSIEGGDSV